MCAVETPNAVRQTAVPIVLAVLASVSGTLVTSAFEASPSMRLFGAALGAAIPPLIAVAGPFVAIRAATGVLVAAGSLFVTYGGFTAVDYATNQEESTFPLPPALPPTSPTPTVPSPTVTPSPGESLETCEGELCITVTPTVLHCSDDGCDDVVTVQSTGAEVLAITTVEFDGPAAGSFSQDGGCENEEQHRELHPGEGCSITVHFTPVEAAEARLVIHQNLKGPATVVALEGEVDATESGKTCEDELCITVTPTVLHCSDDGCDDVVTVRSTGSEILRVTSIELDGPAAGSFGHDGDCENRELAEDEACSITVHFTPGEAGEARLVIHQNLKGPATVVALQGEVDPEPTDGPTTPDPGATETPS
jgi:hypothetical protein